MHVRIKKKEVINLSGGAWERLEGGYLGLLEGEKGGKRDVIPFYLKH